MSSTAVRSPVRQPAQQPLRQPARRPSGSRQGSGGGAGGVRKSAPQVKPGTRLRFRIFAGLVVSSLILLVVAIGALTVQQSYEMKQLNESLQSTAQSHAELISQTANLSSPGRIADWARANGMVTPDEVHILEIPAGNGGK